MAASCQSGASDKNVPKWQDNKIKNQESILIYPKQKTFKGGSSMHKKSKKRCSNGLQNKYREAYFVIVKVTIREVNRFTIR